MIGAYRDAGGRGDLALQVHLSWAPDRATRPWRIAHDQWRSNVFPPPVCWDLDTARGLRRGQRARHARARSRRSSTSPPTSARTPRWLAEYAELGFDKIYLHHVGQEQDAFIDAFGEQGPPPACGAQHEADPDRPTCGGRTPSSTASTSRPTPTATATAAATSAGSSSRSTTCAGLGVTCLWLMPFYPSAGPGRRLRHHRLLRRRPAAGHPRRLRRVRPHRAGPRHPGDRRPGRQPHLGPAPVVPAGAQQPRLAVPRLVRLGRRAAADAPAGRRRSPTRRRASGQLRRGDRPVLPAPLLQAPARPQRRQPRGARRDRPDHRASGCSSGLSGFRVDAVPFLLETTRRRTTPRPARPARLPARPARVPRPAQRRGGPARRGQPALRRPMQFFGDARRRRADHAVRLHRHAGDVPVAGPRRRRPARRGARSGRPSRPRTRSGPPSCATTTS